MNNNLKKLVIDLLPPIVLRFYQRTVKGSGYFGDYPDWLSAKQVSTGYDADLILDKVREALLKVKSGEAVYERDSVLFDKIQYSWPLLAGLLWIASNNCSKLNLIDFGGSLGSTYFQNKKFLSCLQEVHWNIVEQKGFIECGKHYFEDERIKFYSDIEECLKENKTDTILFASVLQYLEKPYDFIEDIIGKKFKYVIIDRTPLIKDQRDRLTIHNVLPDIYTASIPTWFFSEDKFVNVWSTEYDLMAHYDSFEPFTFDGKEVKWSGFIFIKSR